MNGPPSNTINEVPLEVVELPNGLLLCKGTTKMAITSADTQFRELTIYFPQAMETDPVAIFSLVDGLGTGTIFGVFSQKIGHVNGTQVGIEAHNLDGAKTTDDIFCS
jgi:hypothetical protein